MSEEHEVEEVVEKDAVKLKDYKDISKRDRADVEYMKELRALYEEHVEAFKENKNYQQIDNVIWEAEQINVKKAEKIKSDLDRMEVDEADDEDTKELLDKKISIQKQLLANKEIYYISKENKFHVQRDDASWSEIVEAAVHRENNCYDVMDKKAFGLALAALGRNKTDAVYSFHEQPKRVLNKMRTEQWLQPDFDGMNDRSFVFDIMMLSMSGGRLDVIDHIEQVIYWKYKHPEEYRIPCLSIFGSGGLAKNTFAKYVLGGIFGEDQVITLSFSDISQFSGLLKGKTFIYLDEKMSNMEDTNHLKSLVGNPTVTINNKGGKQEPIESTAAWMTGGNDKMGSVLLDGTDADRRWSIIRSTKNVKHWTKELMDLETDEEVKAEMDKNMDVLKDKTELAKWLGYICDKWKNMTGFPEAIHNEDYVNLIERQKKAFDDFMETIFYHDGFTWIKTSVLLDTYVLYMEKYYSSQKNYVLGKVKFYAEVADWLEEICTISVGKKRLRYDAFTDNGNVSVTSDVFIREGLFDKGETHKKDTKLNYLMAQGNRTVLNVDWLSGDLEESKDSGNISPIPII